jgi:2-oxoacid:acceptor oxidoreductase gamma subunit (pyruvate/2-ketoisovalerate family)/2-oxoacid:acceptor oxidoreductase delta subunit (pyruvate/2-ketoisovalerate family)
MVTAFEILAKIFSKIGDFQVQAFPAFGVERTGAPIQAFLRVANKEILNRSNIYHPHFVVVFDESLIGQVPVIDGLRSTGAVLLNTNESTPELPGWKGTIYTVPATEIALELGLGSKSLPIVNIPMIGALAHIFEVDIDLVQRIVRENVPVKPGKNAEAALRAFNKVSGPEKLSNYLQDALVHNVPDDQNGYMFTDEPVLIEPDFKVPFWNSPLSINKTGNWRVVTPEYQTKKPPCTHNCPAGTNVREFVKLTAERKFSEALDVIYQHNPFPSICGRVCPHFCEQSCNRGSLDQSLNIGAIERFLGDKGVNSKVHPIRIYYDEKIAVIGSGPAGLTAALRLRRKGYEVDVFEALPMAGGMMRTGIPKFRLPDEVLDAEIDRIVRQGVNIKVNKKVMVEELAQKYSAVVCAVGSHIGSPLGLLNDSMVTEGISFLRDMKLNGSNGGVQVGHKIAIIGGGNTAIDVARTTIRLGAEPTIYYRRTMKEMPAITAELEEALTEGVRIKFLSQPVGVSANSNGKIVLQIQNMELGEPDESGRRKPIPIPSSVEVILVDKVISATGQKHDNFALRGIQDKPIQGHFTTVNGVPVFGAGDMAWGGTVTEAVGSGNKVAEEVHYSLRDLSYKHETIMPEIVLPEDINFAYFLPANRIKASAYLSPYLYKDFSEVNGGLSKEEVVAEAGRCLHCGECYNCGNCYNYCPDSAITIDDNGRLRIDYDYCKGCGICMQECPCSAITFEMQNVAAP